MVAAGVPTVTFTDAAKGAIAFNGTLADKDTFGVRAAGRPGSP